MPSFDIVSKTDLAEVDNAVQGVAREIGTRFDFKGSKCSIERKEALITVLADDDMKLRQMQELLRGYMVRRKLDAAALDFKEPQKAAGNALRQEEHRQRQRINPAGRRKTVAHVNDRPVAQRAFEHVRADREGDEQQDRDGGQRQPPHLRQP